MDEAAGVFLKGGAIGPGEAIASRADHKGARRLEGGERRRNFWLSGMPGERSEPAG